MTSAARAGCGRVAAAVAEVVDGEARDVAAEVIRGLSGRGAPVRACDMATVPWTVLHAAAEAPTSLNASA